MAMDYNESQSIVIKKILDNPELIEEYELEDFNKYYGIIFSTMLALNAEGSLWVDGECDYIELSKRSEIKLSEISKLVSADTAYYWMARATMLNARKERVLNQYSDNRLTEEELIDELHKYKERMEEKNVVDESDFLMDAVGTWDSKASSKEKPIPITAFKALNFVLPVLRRGELTIISARPATGKSALALQIADNVATGGKRVLYVSLEMQEEAIARRYVQLTNPIGGFQKFDEPSELTKEDWEKIYKSVDRTGGNLIVRKGLNKLSAIRKAALKLKPDLIIIDQLTLIKDPNPRVDLRVAMTNAAYGSKRMAIELDIPIIALTQIKRPNGDKIPPEPQLHDLKESGSIEEAADSVIMIHRVDESQMDNYKRFKGVSYDNLERDGDTPILLKDAKGRNSGLTRACCLYEGERFKFKDVYLDM